MHFLLLWPAAVPDTGGAAAPLVARLRSDPAPAAPSPPTGIAATSPPRHRPPALASAQAAAVTAFPSSPPDITPLLTMEKPARSGSAPPHAAVIEAESASSPSTASLAGGVDADGVRQYRVALAREARRYKRYPARALEAGIGGTVEIRVAVAAGGFAEEVRLGRSSGNESLDAAALDMMREAAPRAAVPEALRQRAFAVSLPVVFDLASE